MALKDKIWNFIVHWCSRHSHPVNAVLHAIGIPATIVGLVFICIGSILTGILLIIGGYILQIIGHVVEGSEVGELMLFKSIFERLASRK